MRFLSSIVSDYNDIIEIQPELEIRLRSSAEFIEFYWASLCRYLDIYRIDRQSLLAYSLNRFIRTSIKTDEIDYSHLYELHQSIAEESLKITLGSTEFFPLKFLLPAYHIKVASISSPRNPRSGIVNLNSLNILFRNSIDENIGSEDHKNMVKQSKVPNKSNIVMKNKFMEFKRPSTHIN